jgi:hypothetical protein
MIKLFGIQFAESTYGRHGLTEKSKHRMSKQIAQELLEDYGDSAYLYCVEKLSTNTQNPQLWRDVLTWLDDTEWVSWLTETETAKENEDEGI